MLGLSIKIPSLIHTRAAAQRGKVGVVNKGEIRRAGGNALLAEEAGKRTSVSSFMLSLYGIPRASQVRVPGVDCGTRGLGGGSLALGQQL
jgi:hypothetical protein